MASHPHEKEKKTLASPPAEKNKTSRLKRRNYFFLFSPAYLAQSQEGDCHVREEKVRQLHLYMKNHSQRL